MCQDQLSPSPHLQKKTQGSEEICSYHQMFSRQKLQKIIFDWQFQVSSCFVFFPVPVFQFSSSIYEMFGS